MTDIYQRILRYLQEEPVAVGATIIAALVVGISMATGTPVETVVAQTVAILGVFATVRASVTPYLIYEEEELEDQYDGPETPEEAERYFGFHQEVPSHDQTPTEEDDDQGPDPYLPGGVTPPLR